MSRLWVVNGPLVELELTTTTLMQMKVVKMMEKKISVKFARLQLISMMKILNISSVEIVKYFVVCEKYGGNHHVCEECCKGSHVLVQAGLCARVVQQIALQGIVHTVRI